MIQAVTKLHPQTLEVTFHHWKGSRELTIPKRSPAELPGLWIFWCFYSWWITRWPAACSGMMNSFPECNSPTQTCLTVQKVLLEILSPVEFHPICCLKPKIWIGKSSLSTSGLVHITTNKPGIHVLKKHLETTSKVPGQEGTMRWTVSIGKGLDATLLRRCFTKAVELCTALSRPQWRFSLRPKMACSWFRCLEKKGCWLLGCKTSFFGMFFALFWKKSRFYVKVRYSDILSNQGMHRRFSCQVLAVHFFCCCGSSMNVNPPTLSTVGGFPNFRFIPCQTWKTAEVT